MKVNISGFDVAMELGYNGVIFSVYDNDDNYLGKLRVGRANVEWCKGKKPINKGLKMKWNKLIEVFEEG